MNSSVGETYYLRVNQNQVLGPIKMAAIRAMLGAGKINDQVEVSPDKEHWIVLRYLLDGSKAFHLPEIEQNEEPLWDFGSSGEASDFDYGASQPPMEDVTFLPGKPVPVPRNVEEDSPAKKVGYTMEPTLAGEPLLPGKLDDIRKNQQGAELPGRPAPLPGIAPVNIPRDSKFADIPLPGGYAPLPGKSAPMPGQAAPMPGRAAPMPGQAAPMPGQAAPMPGQAAPMPGQAAAMPGQAAAMPGQAAMPGAGGFPSSRGPEVDMPTRHLDENNVRGFERDNGANFGGYDAANRAAAGGFSNQFDNAVSSEFSGEQPIASTGSNEFQRDEYAPGANPNLDDLFSGGQQRPSIFSMDSQRQEGIPYGGSSNYGADSQPSAGAPSSSAPYGADMNFGASRRSENQAGASFDLSAGSFQLADPIASPSSPDDNLSGAGTSSPHYGASSYASQSSSAALGEPRSPGEAVEPEETKKTGKMMLILFSVIILVIAGGAAAYFIVQSLPDEETVAVVKMPKVDKVETPPPVQRGRSKEEIDKERLELVISGGPDAKEVSLEAVAFDNFSDYMRLYQNAKSGGNEAMTLLVSSLLRSRYKDTIDVDASLKIAAKLASANSGIDALARGAWDASAGAADAARSYLEQVDGTSKTEKYYISALSGIGDVIALQDYLATSSASEQSRVDGYRKSASRTLQQAININSKLPLAHFWKGYLAEIIGDYNGAIKEYESTLDVQAFHSNALTNLAKVYVKVGKLPKAEVAAHKLIDNMEKISSPSELSRAYEIVGDVAFFEDRFDDAISYLKKAIEVNPANRHAIATITDTFIYTDRTQEGINFFTVSTFIKTESAPVAIAVSRLQIALGRSQEARTTLKKGEKNFPDNPRFPLELGQLLESDRSLTGAQIAYNEALKLNPNLTAAKLGLARIAWSSEHNLSSVETMLNGIKNISQDEYQFLVNYQVGRFYMIHNYLSRAEEYLRKSVNAAPQFKLARLSLVDVLIAQKKFREAFNVISEVKSYEQDPELLTAHAKVYYKSGNVSTARKEINKVLDAHEEFAPALLLLARMAIDNNENAFAKKTLKQVLKPIGDAFADRMIVEGLLAESESNYEGAKMAFEGLKRLRPDERVSFYYMARTYNALGNRNKAIESYSDYIEASSYRVPLIFAYLERGNLYLENGIYKLAEADFENVLNSPLVSEEERSQALNGLSNVSMKQKKFKQAITYLNESLKTKENLGETHFKLGQAYAFAGDSVTAVREFNEAKSLGYNDPEVDRLRAFAFKELGHTAEAKQAFKAYLKTLNPTTQTAEIKEILRQLDTL